MAKQINLDKWPSGDSKPILQIATTIEELSGRLGLRLKRDIDDLDEFSYAVVELADGCPALIHHYDHEPIGGTLVYVDAQADTSDSLGAVRAALELGQTDRVVWEQTII